MIEAQVHQQLREFLRDCGDSSWPHHLTLARLVARALRLGRSALLQVGGLSAYQGDYRLSYLVALLLWPEPAVLVVPEVTQQRILMADLPRLQEKLGATKPIHVGDRWPDPAFRGLLITTPAAWLADRLGRGGHFPSQVPTLLDEVDHLETWLGDHLTAQLTRLDWDQLSLAYPHHRNLIRDTLVTLTYTAFQHPSNPYQCYLLDQEACGLLQNLYQTLVAEDERAAESMPLPWQRFWQQFAPPDHLLWVAVDHQSGQIALHCAPVDLAQCVADLWQQQPVVLIGASLDQDAKAEIFRQRLGLEDLTCLKFAPHRHHDLVNLYLPTHLPLPNTRQFQAMAYQEIRRLLVCAQPANRGLTLILVNDLPLKGQLAAALAGEFGSRVQVEPMQVGQNTILVSSWEFWHQHRLTLPVPTLLILATLPLPSLENPLVAGRVAFHKRRRQDWFRLYLFPTAMAEMQRAIAPLRATSGLVAILDTRIHYRSYGQQMLEALSPTATTRSLQPDWDAQTGV
ncbi:MAG TPA: ATP-dependent DNA helicase [Leptolyngbyaceae cyanobacterium M65_K2018_010]|nr:ATP-dependent DNA helicase [Leptolyngbyaceae cyanobacterium M65_K2018_010]